MPETTHTWPTPCSPARRVGGTTVLELRGEIDIRTAPFVAARLDALTSCPRPDLVLDLRGTTFIDCAGIGVLCRARNRVLARHGRLRLVSTDPRFPRILRAVHLADVFDVWTRLPETATGPVAVAG
ncbi:STAS domain-containing protein [Streptomyces sp. B93]|uniref:STAS domain-containing protein n=1 Tax=Streptomyces sp. B93 TaxID=2824875 RepID=UPI001B35A2EC|nr:STAS domain-containing protein [Streptomyces sp. B93]MBQ1089901.1 STAS domain-containing protein [Streptomyces sp. B93]